MDSYTVFQPDGHCHSIHAHAVRVSAVNSKACSPCLKNVSMLLHKCYVDRQESKYCTCSPAITGQILSSSHLGIGKPTPGRIPPLPTCSPLAKLLQLWSLHLCSCCCAICSMFQHNLLMVSLLHEGWLRSQLPTNLLCLLLHGCRCWLHQ